MAVPAKVDSNINDDKGCLIGSESSPATISKYVQTSKSYVETTMESPLVDKRTGDLDCQLSLGSSKRSLTNKLSIVN